LYNLTGRKPKINILKVMAIMMMTMIIKIEIIHCG